MTMTSKKYAIDKKKQATLDGLKANVLRAQYKVDQLQAIVASLNEKQTVFNTNMANAEVDQETANSNLGIVKEVVSGIREMVLKTVKVETQTRIANRDTKKAAAELSGIAKQLIFCMELIDKLNLLITRKQGTRVVISHEMISTIASAVNDANGALAATLTALDNCYTAASTGIESVRTTTLEYKQALKLFGVVTGLYKKNEDKEDGIYVGGVIEAIEKWESEVKRTGTDYDKNEVSTAKQNYEDERRNLMAKLKMSTDITPVGGSLYNLLQQALEEAKHRYKIAQSANSQVKHELSQATIELESATVDLESLKSGLSAATAAALSA